MRLLVESDFRPAGGIIGAGFDELRWPLPVRPGDQLHVESEVLDVRPSKSRPHLGLVKVRITTTNQHGEAVQVFVANIVVPRRPAERSQDHRPPGRAPHLGTDCSSLIFPSALSRTSCLNSGVALGSLSSISIAFCAYFSASSLLPIAR